MKRALAAILLILSPAEALAHACDTDAIKRAMPLLKLHFDGDQVENAGIDDTVKQLPSIKALKGQRQVRRARSLGSHL
jgi:hypothetical protein